MEINLAELDRKTCYKLTSGLVVPRPIAWLNTLNADGGCNTAPFSFFNALGPDLVVFSVGDREEGGIKDSAANLKRHPEFVLHLTDEDTVEAMNFTSGDFPPGFQEAEEIGLTLVPSSVVRVPRIAEAPVAFEGRVEQELEMRSYITYHIFLGHVLRLHVRDDLLKDNFRIDWRAYRPIARLAGDAYAYVREFFALRRPTYARFLEDPEAVRSHRRGPLNS